MLPFALYPLISDLRSLQSASLAIGVSVYFCFMFLVLNLPQKRSLIQSQPLILNVDPTTGNTSTHSLKAMGPSPLVLCDVISCKSHIAWYLGLQLKSFLYITLRCDIYNWSPPLIYAPIKRPMLNRADCNRNYLTAKVFNTQLAFLQCDSEDCSIATFLLPSIDLLDPTTPKHYVCISLRHYASLHFSVFTVLKTHLPI